MARSLKDTTATSTSRAPRRATSSTRKSGPERLGQWELLAVAAEGAFAHVYRAQAAGRASPNEQGYAIKRLKPRFESDPTAVRLLRREARIGSAITSSHLVPILAAHVDEPPYYLVMPWLAGQTLAARLAVQRKLGVGEALWLARQVAEGLAALEEAGWIHADVKPANVMVSPEGHATLLDLGFARRPADEDQASRPMVGTPWYMAPETFVSAVRPDVRSDIFSLGVVLYEMLAGRRPFEAVTAAGLINAHRQQEPPPIRELVPEMPSDVAKLVHAMLAKEPLRRPQTAVEVVTKLTALEVECFGECGMMNDER
ncbi:MAG: serine/threonine protein kinase [Planctomycetia bacterium]|nr:serine/threonine protein kinase [Planctomycetia bacterium]